MRTPLLFLAVTAAAFVAPEFAIAQAGTAAASPHTFAVNLSLVSDYRFRGITQSFGKPALQGGFDYAHASGLYLGNWNSNISETAGFPNGNLEMDFYGGWKTTVGGFGVDAGLIHYFYPGSTKGGSPGAVVCNLNATPLACASGDEEVRNTELYVGGSWKWLSLKYSRAVSDYFSIPDTKGTHYLDLSATYDLGNGWGINGHVGRLSVKNFGSASYTDYKLGVTKDVSGFVFGASYVATNADDDCGVGVATPQPYCFAKNVAVPASIKTYEGGKGAVLLSVSRTF